MTNRRHEETPANTDGPEGRAHGPVAFQIEETPPVRALVVHVAFKAGAIKAQAPDETSTLRDETARLEEAEGLALAIDLDIAGSEIVTVARVHPATLIGPGKVEEIAEAARAQDVGLVVVNATLSPVQQRNLERAFKAKVLDRTGLILEIFGRRAQTKEGRLQVELAHLSYQKSRLVRSWTHLERQRGGFGFMGGPGETQIEADRRIIQDRITRIRQDLEKVRRRRELHRANRQRVPYPVVALVGYTNAGKSTLFNRLTTAHVDAEDLLFATLDPTMRRLELPHGRTVILSDTVGFISDLPTDLVAAFRATLEEVLEAEIILHVRDISHPDTGAQAADVAQVLAELGVDEARRDRIVEVWNKADRLAGEERTAIENQAMRSDNVALISAMTGEGIDTLLALVERTLAERSSRFRVTLEPTEGRRLSWLYDIGEVLERHDGEDGRVTLVVRVPPEKVGPVEARLGASAQALDSTEHRSAAE